MAKLKRYEPLPELIEAVFRGYEESARGAYDDPFTVEHPMGESRSEQRPYLGASVLGEKCLRKLWYSFRWAQKVEHDGKTLALFETGHLEEVRMKMELRRAGVWVDDRDGHKQHSASALAGHVSGHLDAIVRNVPGLPPEEWMGCEIKTHKASSFLELVLDGVKRSKPLHFVQCQVYMKLKNLRSFVYYAKNKDNDERHAELVRFDEEEFEKQMGKARLVVFADEAPERISEKPNEFPCSYCDFRPVCHERQIPDVSCRSCLHIRPQEDGSWFCGKHKTSLDVETQRRACDFHLYNWTMLPYGRPVDACSEGVLYPGMIINERGAGRITRP